jgi:N-acyl-L-homoserine lactone synthetase
MIEIITNDNKKNFDKRLHSMFEERKIVFVDLLKWDLPITDGHLEIDQFDDEHAIYLLASDEDGSHFGSMRLLPTERPHILGSFFPHLADKAVPMGPDTLEVTRLCLSPRLRAAERRHVRNQLISALTDYALANRINTLTGVARISWLAQILRMGWRCETLGSVQSVDGTLTGAFRIDLDSDTPGGLANMGVYLPGTSAAFEDRIQSYNRAAASRSSQLPPDASTLDCAIDRWAECLKADGYCIIPDAIPLETVATLNDGLNARFSATPFCEGGFYGPRTKRFGSLLTQGSRLIGSYDSVVAFGQSRALLVWQRIVMPDGSSIQIDNLPATDAAGYAGLEDEVDYHTWTLLKGIAMSTLLGVGTQVTFGSGQSNLVQAIQQSTQESANQAGQRIVEKDINIQPTITIRPGFPLRVVVHKDLVFR